LKIPSFQTEFTNIQKALYGLKQAPRAWYDRLKNFLLAQGFKMGCVDKTLFLMRSGSDFLLVQIYVDYIIFDGSSHALVSKFSDQMSSSFFLFIYKFYILLLSAYAQKEGNKTNKKKKVQLLS